MNLALETKRITMKKLLLITLTIPLLNIWGQNVNIPDSNLKNALLAHSPTIDTNGDNEIQVSEAAAFTNSLYLNNMNINDATGINAFTNITQLIISRNNLTNLDISNLVNLESLDCSWQNLTTLDLSNNNLINNLNFRNNQISSINTSNLSNLTHYTCAQNQLTSIDVSNNSNLINLDCSYMNIHNLDISNNTQLQYLDCWQDSLSSIDVSNNTALIRFRCPYNQISNIDVSNNINLVNFQCFDNNLSSIDVTNNTLLDELSISQNNISALDVSNNPLLEKLYYNNNNISTLDISNNTLIEYLGCKNNGVTTIDLSSLSNLISLNAENNLLSSINLTNNTNLQTLRLSYNQIDSLDLSNNINLTFLVLLNSGLEFLDLRNGNNYNMTNVSMGMNNDLYCANVDDSTYSENNWRTSTIAVGNNTVFNGDCENSCYIPYRTKDTLSTCPNYNFNGNIITNSGNYTDTLTSMSSCKDSIVQLNITILNSSSSTDTQTACGSYTWIDGNTYISNNNTATYTTTNVAGCDSIITLDLTVHNIDTSITQNNLTLTSNVNGAQYQWIECDNFTDLMGETNMSFTPTTNGSYAVEITIPEGCVDTSSCYTILNTSIDELSSNTKIYPQPFQDEINLNFNKSGERTVKIYNINGKEISSQLTSENTLKINTSKLSKGIYILKITNNTSTNNYTIVKH